MRSHRLVPTAKGKSQSETPLSQNLHEIALSPRQMGSPARKVLQGQCCFGTPQVHWGTPLRTLGAPWAQLAEFWVCFFLTRLYMQIITILRNSRNSALQTCTRCANSKWQDLGSSVAILCCSHELTAARACRPPYLGAYHVKDPSVISPRSVYCESELMVL